LIALAPYVMTVKSEFTDLAGERSSAWSIQQASRRKVFVRKI
jgi:hypothetical protein